MELEQSSGVLFTTCAVCTTHHNSEHQSVPGLLFPDHPRATRIRGVDHPFKYDCKEGAAKVNAAWKMLSIFIGGAGAEDGCGIGGGGANVGWEEGAGDGDVNGGDRRVEVVGGDDTICFAP